MATYALVAGGVIVQTAAETFPVHVDLTWTGDISAVSPEPAPGWTATKSDGAWTFAAPVEAGANLAAAAQAALEASDRTVLRCYEHAIAVPAEWVSYRAALRATAAGTGTAGTLPTRPDYPAGT